jgi:hypothetical protein
MNNFELLTGKGSFVFCIFGNTEASQFELVLLDRERMCEEQNEAGFPFLGLVGLVEGRGVSALSEPLDGPTILALSQAYTRLVEDRINKSMGGPARLARNTDEN